MNQSTEYVPALLSSYDIITDKRGNRAGRKKENYINVVCSFDIETSLLHINDDDYAIMYIWMFDIDAKYQIIGRTWEEYTRLTTAINEFCGDRVKLVVYVHNLSFEFSFLQSIYKFKREDVFAMKPHKVLKATAGSIEYRCNLLRTNMSLDKWLDKLPVEHKKLVGHLDYSVVRYPWTNLTEREMQYCLNDVIGLTEGIKVDMENNNDTLITIPLTSTGYLRRLVKSSMRHYPHYRLQETIPPLEVYRFLRRAFEGGDTHANRHFSGRIIENVENHDRSSSYPAVQCNEKFPVGRWRKSRLQSVEVLQNLSKSNYAFVADITITNIVMSDYYYPDPIISLSKCWENEGVVVDNGRVLKADKISITVTDVKYFDICSVYSWDGIEIGEIYYSKYGWLPREYTSIIKEQYTLKTQLKDVEEQEYYYNKAKNIVNSCYGLSAQDPGKTTYDFIDGEFLPSPEGSDGKYLHAQKGMFLSYAWGVWTTAWARHHLLEGINVVYDQGGYVYYWDTDSVKHSPGIDFTDYNNKRVTECLCSEASATDSNGKIHHMGVYERERDYKRFKTLGAKKYAYEDTNGELHITIAGVVKSAGAEELDENGGLEAFKEGFCFVKAGGTKVKYHSNINFEYDTGEGLVRITDNAAITPTTYKVGITADYQHLLDLLLSNKKGREILCNMSIDKTQDK